MSLSRPVFQESQQLLKRLYRQSRHYQVRQRAHCILLRSQGYSVAQLMDILLVSRKTIYNWFNAWESGGMVGLYNRPGRGRKPTFSAQEQEQIRLWAQESPNQLKQVVAKAQAAWGKPVSTETIKRVLKGLHMSWHRFRRTVGGKPDAQEYADKQAQLEELQRLEDAGEVDLYYLDESGFSLVPCLPSGWQPIGETLEIPSTRSARLNVLGLMTRFNQLYAYTSKQSITSEVVAACVDEFFPRVSKRTVIVVDQASIHTSAAIEDKLEEWNARQIELLVLPSYSPQLNLIEILWRFIKYEWMEISAYQSWQHLVDFVEKVLREFGDKYVINFA
jgi:transposase